MKQLPRMTRVLISTLLFVIVLCVGLVVHNLNLIPSACARLAPSVPLDVGIPIPTLIRLIEEIDQSRPNCRITSISKSWSSIEVNTAWITNSYRRDCITYKEHDSSWEEVNSRKDIADGITPSDLISLLQRVSQHPERVEKGVLYVRFRSLKLEIQTGVSNHSAGGTGNTIIFEMDGTNWVHRGVGYWISQHQNAELSPAAVAADEA